MRILLDESLPRRLKDELPGHNVSTVVECGWSGTKNGTLLALAATNFDVFLTADQNLQFQQNLAALPISVIVLVSSDSRLDSLRLLVPEILVALISIQPRSLVRVGNRPPAPQRAEDVT
jgi:predicted nuclease of predicted toxin-antitoxin system